MSTCAILAKFARIFEEVWQGKYCILNFGVGASFARPFHDQKYVFYVKNDLLYS